MAWKYHEALMTSIPATILSSKFADVKSGEVDSEDEEDGGDDSEYIMHRCCD